jgi:nicotinate-nucleotide adenylyltransferase
LRFAIIAGTFNPPHVGHIFLAEEVLFEMGCEKVLLIPSVNPAHKEIPGDISYQDRFAMLQLAATGIDFLEVKDAIDHHKPVARSIHILDWVHDNYELKDKPGLVIGDDLFEGFGHWNDPQSILAKADLLIAHRLYSHRVQSPFPHHYLDNRIYPVSSSEIRDRIKAERSIRYLVPPAVEEYIRRKGFYTDPPGVM